MKELNIILIGLIILGFVGLCFLNKKMNQEHEIRIIEKLRELSHKKIKAQAEYKKASENKKKGVIGFLNQMSKMLFTLF